MPVISFGANSFYRLLANCETKPGQLLLFGINSLSASHRAEANSAMLLVQRELNYLKPKVFIKSVDRKQINCYYNVPEARN